jgi:hypothetical protein
MRTAVLVAIAVCFAWSEAPSADPPKPPYDLDFVAGFVAGEYVAIGRKPESDATYTGRMIFTHEGKDLEFTRTVGGDTQCGTVVLDTKAAESGRPVLRIRFSVNDQPYEATYLWHSDLSNFARLTGYVYLQKGNTKFPGLEALFPLVDYNRNVDDTTE